MSVDNPDESAELRNPIRVLISAPSISLHVSLHKILNPVLDDHFPTSQVIFIERSRIPELPALFGDGYPCPAPLRYSTCAIH